MVEVRTRYRAITFGIMFGIGLLVVRNLASGAA
jgi:hypothetical protein